MVTHRPYSHRQPLIVFAGGGTGGHLYPAIAVADALRSHLPNVRFRFFGTDRAVDRHILGQAEFELVPQTLPAIERMPWRWPRAYLGFRRASLLCRSLYTQDPPAVVVGTRGLASVPAVREAARVGIPVVLLNPDARPGRANLYLARFANVVFAQWEDTVEYLPEPARVVICGCPVRAAFHHATRDAGLKRFGLDDTRRTLLVTGASQGARTINNVFTANLAYFESLRGWQILHLTGDRDYAEVHGAYEGRSLRAVVLPFTDYMAEAVAAADLFIGRAGASSLAEITFVGRASILMPYPFHKDKHQLANAKCLARELAARIVDDHVDPEINGPVLRHAVAELTADDAARDRVACRAKRLGRRDAASTIAQVILDLAEAHRTLRPGESLEPAC